MVGVRNIPEARLTGKITKVELRRVGQEELVAGRVDEELRHREAGAILIRLDELHQRTELRGSPPFHDALLDVVLDGRRPEAVRAPVMDERWLDVQQVDHERRNGDDPSIDGCRRPGRPSALRGSGHDEARHRRAAARRRGRECADRVHRAHGALGHRKLRRPANVAGFEKLVPRVRNEIVLDTRLVLGIPTESDRLIWHEPKFSDDRVGRPRDADKVRRRLRRTRPRA